MVHPIVEYASTVWDPHTTMNINKVEAIQRAAARMYKIVNDMISIPRDYIFYFVLPSTKERILQTITNQH